MAILGYLCEHVGLLGESWNGAFAGIEGSKESREVVEETWSTDCAKCLADLGQVIQGLEIMRQLEIFAAQLPNFYGNNSRMRFSRHGLYGGMNEGQSLGRWTSQSEEYRVEKRTDLKR